MNKKETVFFWRCHHSSGHGLDRECCNAKGRLSSLNTAIDNAKAHNESHRWSGWGYSPWGWRNQTVNVFRKNPSGKEKLVVSYNEL